MVTFKLEGTNIWVTVGVGLLEVVEADSPYERAISVHLNRSEQQAIAKALQDHTPLRDQILIEPSPL